MSHTVVRDDFFCHVKTIGLSEAACGVWVRGLSWVGHKESDGRISKAAAKRMKMTQGSIDELVKAGLWEPAEDGNGWLFHDYLDINPSREELEAEREAVRKRVAKHRAKRKEDVESHALHDHRNLSEQVLAPNAAARVVISENDNEIINLGSVREAERVGAEWFFALTLRRPDFQSWRTVYARIGAKPAAERDLVAKHWRATKYIEERPSAFNPEHAIKHWDDFVAGPRGELRPLVPARTQRRSSTASSEAELSNVPIPEWAEAK